MGTDFCRKHNEHRELLREHGELTIEHRISCKHVEILKKRVKDLEKELDAEKERVTTLKDESMLTATINASTSQGTAQSRYESRKFDISTRNLWNIAHENSQDLHSIYFHLLSDVEIQNRYGMGPRHQDQDLCSQESETDHQKQI